MKLLARIADAGVFVVFAAIVGIALAYLLNDARAFCLFVLFVCICVLVIGVYVVICHCSQVIERHRTERRRDRQCL